MKAKRLTRDQKTIAKLRAELVEVGERSRLAVEKAELESERVQANLSANFTKRCGDWDVMAMRLNAAERSAERLERELDAIRDARRQDDTMDRVLETVTSAIQSLRKNAKRPALSNGAVVTSPGTGLVPEAIYDALDPRSKRSVEIAVLRAASRSS